MVFIAACPVVGELLIDRVKNMADLFLAVFLLWWLIPFVLMAALPVPVNARFELYMWLGLEAPITVQYKPSECYLYWCPLGMVALEFKQVDLTD